MINWYLDDIAVNGRCAYLDNDDIRVTMPVADLGGAPGAPPSTAQNVLNFMQFFGKYGKIICWCPPLEGWHPLQRGILDPPLHATYM